MSLSGLETIFLAAFLLLLMLLRLFLLSATPPENCPH